MRVLCNNVLLTADNLQGLGVHTAKLCRFWQDRQTSGCGVLMCRQAEAAAMGRAAYMLFGHRGSMQSVKLLC